MFAILSGFSEPILLLNHTFLSYYLHIYGVGDNIFLRHKTK